MAANVVEILVKATDDTKGAYAGAKANAEGAAEGADAYAEATDRAAEAEARFRQAQADVDEALARQDQLQQSGTATADELAAAQDRVTQATLASIDAQTRLAAADARVAEASAAAGDAAEESAAKTDTSGGLMAGAGAKMKMALLGVGVGLGLAVKGAADFQVATTRLVTSAGESAKNLGMVQQGLLSMSGATNTSVSDLASGMYMVESAGFHGAEGLKVLHAAAQGAAMEGAQLSTVSNAVTSALNAYGLSGDHATAVTQQMLAAVGQGKMTFEDLAGSLSAVLPVAASAHISLAQVGGAIATMTMQGMSAQQASQDLANMIRGLVSPSATASAEMKALGLNANDVARNVGRAGLTGTLQTLTDAILNNTHGGSVMVGYMHEMTPAAQGLAREILAGTISTNSLRTAVKGLNPEQAKLISLFETSATSATGLKQTYDSAMKTMTGGATGLNVALMIGGQHAKTFADNVKAVGAAAKTSGGDVAGWGAYQNQANVQIGEAVKAIEAMGDSLGLALLPAVTAIMKPITDMLEVISRNKDLAYAFAAVAGGVLAGALGGKLAGALTSLKGTMSSLGEGIGWLAGKFGILTGATETQTVAEEDADAAAAANPFGAVIVVITLLVIAIVELIRHWHQLSADTKKVFDDLKRLAGDLWHDIEAVFSHMWSWVVSRAAEAWRDMVWLTENAFDHVRHDLAHWGDDILSFFKSLPGKIIAALGDLGTMLLNFGEHIMDKFGDGIAAGFDHVRHDVAHYADDLFGWIPHSPAKWGPLSGDGAPEPSGRRIARQLAQGIMSGLPDIRGAMNTIGLAAGRPGAGYGGAYGAAGRGQQPIVIEFHGSRNGLDGLFWTWFQQGIRVRGGDPQIVQRKVVFR